MLGSQVRYTNVQSGNRGSQIRYSNMAAGPLAPTPVQTPQSASAFAARAAPPPPPAARLQSATPRPPGVACSEQRDQWAGWRGGDGWTGQWAGVGVGAVLSCSGTRVMGGGVWAEDKGRICPCPVLTPLVLPYSTAAIARGMIIGVCRARGSFWRRRRGAGRGCLLGRWDRLGWCGDVGCGPRFFTPRCPLHPVQCPDRSRCHRQHLLQLPHGKSRMLPRPLHLHKGIIPEHRHIHVHLGIDILRIIQIHLTVAGRSSLPRRTPRRPRDNPHADGCHLIREDLGHRIQHAGQLGSIDGIGNRHPRPGDGRRARPAIGLQHVAVHKQCQAGTTHHSPPLPAAGLPTAANPDRSATPARSDAGFPQTARPAWRYRGAFAWSWTKAASHTPPSANHHCPAPWPSATGANPAQSSPCTTPVFRQTPPPPTRRRGG